jgi:hypothetical protein
MVDLSVKAQGSFAQQELGSTEAKLLSMIACAPHRTLWASALLQKSGSALPDFNAVAMFQPQRWRVAPIRRLSLNR